MQPFYRAARTATERPQVAVGGSISGPLSSARREDIAAARDEKETIGDGTHERVVVNVARFDERVQKKLAAP